MQYRKFGKLDWQVSVLGFGAMRLPTIGEDQSKIDEPEAIKMIRYAADNGVNYIDSAYLYHMGQSEVLVGKALKDGYRQKMKVATKLPARMVEKAEDFDRILGEQLKKLDIGMIDFYLLHGLDRAGWTKVRDFGVLKWAEKQMAQGKIGRLGFSFHDSFDVFKEIVDSYDSWVLSQVLYNYMDENEQAGRKGVEYAASKGIAVVVMEPLRGGKLAKDPPPQPVAEVLKNANRKMKGVEWAFHWVWNQPEITLALSGMSTMQQVVANVKIADKSKPGFFSAKDFAVIGKIKEAYKSLSPIPCSGCRYCVPCPYKVEIPRVFQIYNDAVMYDDMRGGKFMYNGPFGIPQDQRADQCTECEECLAKCPQKIEIPDWLKKAHEALYSSVPLGPPIPPPPKPQE
ncbi:MAG: aldo/keto reductase [Chloroflexi bacterium RBG_16_50_11]|nr:MAG: aldo/keto reductase [Chloroflexi bacterium RBG_16_50_11]